MTPWSVIASAGICSSAALAMSPSTRLAPSSIEYSVWVWRWTKESGTRVVSSAVGVAAGEGNSRSCCSRGGADGGRSLAFASPQRSTGTWRMGHESYQQVAHSGGVMKAQSALLFIATVVLAGGCGDAPGVSETVTDSTPAAQPSEA